MRAWAHLFASVLYFFLVLAVVYCGRNNVSMVIAKAGRPDMPEVQICKSNTVMSTNESTHTRNYDAPH